VKEYTVTINGIEHTMRLSDEDAKRLGVQASVVVKSKAPANKSRATKTSDK
jgi:hypothetical protein